MTGLALSCSNFAATQLPVVSAGRLLARCKAVNAEAAAEIDLLKSDPSPSGRAYKLLGREQHTNDAKRIAIEKSRLIALHLARALFEAQQADEKLAKALIDFENAERQPPSLEDRIMAMTGSIGWSIENLLLGSLLEQVTVRNVREALRVAPPSERLAMYEAATMSAHDPVSAITIKVMELERVAYPADVSASPTEGAAAAQLGRLIAAAQQARVPDTSEIHAVLTDVGRALRQAELAGVQPVNPSHPGSESLEPLPEPVAVEE